VNAATLGQTPVPQPDCLPGVSFPSWPARRRSSSSGSKRDASVPVAPSSEHPFRRARFFEPGAIGRSECVPPNVLSQPGQLRSPLELPFPQAFLVVRPSRYRIFVSGETLNLSSRRNHHAAAKIIVRTDFRLQVRSIRYLSQALLLLSADLCRNELIAVG